MLSRLGVCLLVAIALLAAGCGSSGSSASFQSSFAADRTQFRQAGDHLGAELDAAAGQTDAQVAAAFGSLAAQLTGVKHDLAGLQPPEQYKTETAKLLSAFGSLIAEVRAIEHDAASHNASRAASDTLSLVQGAASVKALDNRISRQLGLPG